MLTARSNLKSWAHACQSCISKVPSYLGAWLQNHTSNALTFKSQVAPISIFFLMLSLGLHSKYMQFHDLQRGSRGLAPPNSTATSKMTAPEMTALPPQLPWIQSYCVRMGDTSIGSGEHKRGVMVPLHQGHWTPGLLLKKQIHSQFHQTLTFLAFRWHQWWAGTWEDSSRS